jgi:transposase
MALFPPGKGGGQSVDYGYKGKGVTIHLLVDGNGMPLSATTTPASGSEREQVSPLLERVKVYHGYGRPKRCPKEIHADKGYDSKALRIFLRSKGLRPVIPKRTWRARKQPSGKKVAGSTSRWQVERCFAWMQRKYRRLVARWERRDLYWNGFLQLSIIMIWLERLV